MFEDETMAEKISNQKEESDNRENFTDSKKQTLERVSSETSSNNASEEDVNISKDQK